MMRSSSLPPIYVALRSVEAGIQGLGRVLDRAGLASFLDPSVYLDEEGGIRRSFFAMSSLAGLKTLGVLGAEWPDDGHIRMDIVIHDELVDGDGHPIGPHADVLISLVAPEPWTAANLPPLFSAQIAAFPVQVLPRDDGPVYGRGLKETIIAVQPKSPSFHYALALPELPPVPVDEPPPPDAPPVEVIPPEILNPPPPPVVEEPPADPPVVEEPPPPPVSGGIVDADPSMILPPWVEPDPVPLES